MHQAELYPDHASVVRVTVFCEYTHDPLTLWGCGFFARVGRIGSPPGYTNALPPKGAMGEAPRGAPARVRMVPTGSTVALPLRGAQHATLARRGHKSAPFGRIYLKLRGSSMKMISADKFAAWTQGPWQSPVEHLKAQDRAPASIGASTGRSRDKVSRR